ncbi:autotransporter outer membrane beta-barrel domain-containing protein [Pollutimonas harenae]|uniref:Autotransporter domain-containing protein n=1 Tax=Pollutimonas harenae TaxID=657015 RepID=A0A853H2D0_9BURK|nr:autotransporter outer membrane beta-barrel domain-containing protein [Pollutimonas harenae]NYT84314.1 autotransporter domain-containing protein [Pollutimonas harenae]TEA73283.1 autotransporter domain-containing protein [Pollutimonas harenae]
MTYKHVLLLTITSVAMCASVSATPPPPGSDWVHTEAQLGLPNVPFVFSKDGLYTAASFESSRAFHIDQHEAAIHTDANTTLHISGPVSSVAGSTQSLAKYGGGTLVLSGQNQYNGNTLLHEGTLGVQGNNALGTTNRTLHMYSGTSLNYAADAAVYNVIQLQPGTQPNEAVTWRVDQGTATQYGAVVGSVPISKQGAGRLYLPAYVTTPTLAVVEQGSLAIGGFFAGPIHVRRGARLEGSGAIDSVLIQGGGTLAPGLSSAPAMIVMRRLQLEADATLEINVQADGQSDKVQVLETAELAGQVLVRAQDGDWQPRTHYTILQADQGLGDTRFARATTIADAANMPFLKPELSYDTQHVYLSLVRNETPLEEAGETPTEDEVAQVIDQEGGSNPALQDHIITLDKPKARQAFQQLSGSWAASIASRMLDDSRFVREAALQHASATHTTSHAWQHAWYSSARRNAAQGTPGDNRDTGGLVLGGTQHISDNLSASAYLGVQQSRMWRTALDTHANIDSQYVGLTLARGWRGLKWILGATHGWHAVNSRRSLSTAGLNDSPTGRYRGKTLQLFTEFTAPLSRLIPFIRFAWVRQQTRGYSEQGDMAALTVESSDQTVLFSSLGLKAVHTLHIPNGQAQLRGELAWHHASGDVRSYSRQSFRDSPKQTVFTSEGLALARHAWSLQLGVEASLAKHGRLGFSYAGQYASGRQDHGARVNVSWAF